MKSKQDLNYPEDFRYTETHEWIKKEGDFYRIGVTDFAQDQLGGIVWVELPEEGEVFEQGEVFGTLESSKAVSEILMPLSGTIVDRNLDLEEHPERINQNPYETWLVKVKGEASESKWLTAEEIQETLE